MYPIERFLKKLKDYVGNKACPEGSIVQGYLLEEIVSFCSMYMEDISTHFNPIQRYYEGVPKVSDDASNSVFNQPGRFLRGKVENRQLSEEERDLAHMYILQQVERFEKFSDEHARLLQSNTYVEFFFLK